MPAGRPTKYTPEFIQKVDDYLALCGREQTKLPKKEEFARIVKVDPDKIAEYCSKYPEFHVAIKKIEEAQRSQLMDDGLYGGKEVNSAMAIFLLKVNHGMIETSRVENTGKDGKPIENKMIVEIVEEKHNGYSISNKKL